MHYDFRFYNTVYNSYHKTYRYYFLTIVKTQPFRKLFDHIIYGDIKTRYNVFRKYANDVFGEYDFMVQKLLKSYIIRLFRKSPRSEALKSCLLQRDDGSHRRR